jgi:hypothetical protein
MNSCPYNVTLSISEADLSADHWEEIDQQDARDVFFANLLPGEPEISPDLRSAFEGYGYSVTRVELARTHPVVVLRMTRRRAPQMTDDGSLRRHFQVLFRQAGFRLRRDELIFSQLGNRVMVAFLWKDAPVDFAPTAEELEAQYEPIP